MDALEKMAAAKRSKTPTTGYNVVGVDDFEMPGEELYLICHCETRAEADKVVAERTKKNPGATFYVYGPPAAGGKP
jgi:hypothetical protein